MGFFEMRDLPFEVCQDSGIQSKMGEGFGTESMHPDARCLDRDYRIERVRDNGIEEPYRGLLIWKGCT